MVKVPGGGVLYREGQPITKVYVLVSGLYRCYTVSESGVETTDGIGARRGLPVVPNADLEMPARSNVALVEDSELLCCELAELRPLVACSARLMKAWNGHLVSAWLRQMSHKEALLKYDNKGRYLWFLEEYPGMIDRVQHYILASFLGMSPVTLSRTRTKVAAERDVAG